MSRQLSAILLLISDDEALGRSMRGQLEGDAIDVVQTSYCSDAGVLMQRHSPDLIAVDMTLSSMSGSRLVDLSKEAKGFGIPLVLVSSRPAVEVAELARLICASGIISRRTAAGQIGVPVRRLIHQGFEFDIGPLRSELTRAGLLVPCGERPHAGRQDDRRPADGPWHA